MKQNFVERQQWPRRGKGNKTSLRSGKLDFCAALNKTLKFSFCSARCARTLHAIHGRPGMSAAEVPPQWGPAGGSWDLQSDRDPTDGCPARQPFRSLQRPSLLLLVKDGKLLLEAERDVALKLFTESP